MYRTLLLIHRRYVAQRQEERLSRRLCIALISPELLHILPTRNSIVTAQCHSADRCTLKIIESGVEYSNAYRGRSSLQPMTKTPYIMNLREEVRQTILAWRTSLGVNTELMTPIELQLIQHSIDEIGTKFPRCSLHNPANSGPWSD